MKSWEPTFKDRPLSWSQLSAFEWNKEEWYDRYVLFKKPVISREMEFGTMVDQRLQEDPAFHPEIPRGESLQHKILTKFEKMHLIAILDSFSPSRRIPKFGASGTVKTKVQIDDYKTGKKAWDQKRIDESGQLTFYAFTLWLHEKIHPKDVALGIWWLPTQENGDFSISQLKGSKVQHFQSSRTMQDLLKFGKYIKATVKEMEEYVKERAH